MDSISRNSFELCHTKFLLRTFEIFQRSIQRSTCKPATDFFFSTMELALLQMAPPLITENVFLPSKLVLLSQPLLTSSLLFFFSPLFLFYFTP